MKMVRLTLPFICAMPLLVRGQDATYSDASSRIIALENAWNRALEFRDIKAVDPLLDNALVFVDINGRLMTKAEVLADVKASPVQQTVSDGLTVHVHGSTAIVTGMLRMRGVEKGKPFQRRGRYVDTWAHKDGNWVCIASQLTPLRP